MSDLDDEELRETKVINGIIAGDKLYTEKEAKEMFNKKIEDLMKKYENKRSVAIKSNNYSGITRANCFLVFINDLYKLLEV